MPRLIKDTKEARDFASIEARLDDNWEHQLELVLLHLTEQLSKEMVDKGINRTALAEQLGVTKAYISQVFRADKKNLQLDTLFKLADKLGLRPTISLHQKSFAEAHLIEWQSPGTSAKPKSVLFLYTSTTEGKPVATTSHEGYTSAWRGAKGNTQTTVEEVRYEA